MKFFLIALAAIFCSFSVSAQLVLNELSQGTSGNKEYVELVVKGTRTCSDSCADIRGWIFDDQNGWFGGSAISAGCYRFASNANWSCVPYGSIIVIYNDGDKNTAITQADDPTDANHDGVYILPVTSAQIELNGSFPTSASGSSFTYPSTGFGTSTSWTNLAFNNNGDAFVIINPAAPSTAYHSFSYGNITGGAVYLSASGSQRVFYATGSQYALSSAWTSGSAPTNETPGAPNTAANTTWINSMKLTGPGGGVSVTVYDTACIGSTYTFNGNPITAAGTYKDTLHTIIGCDSVVTLHLYFNPLPAAPTIVATLAYCQDSVALPLTANGQNLLWYTSPTGTGSPTAPTPATTTPGIYTYYVSQTVKGCTGNKAQITVQVYPNPAPPLVVTPLIYCKNQAVPQLTATGQNLRWYSAPAGGTGNATAPIPNTGAAGTTPWFVTQKVNGCESQRAVISITIQEVIAAFTTSKDTVCAKDTLYLTNASVGNQLAYNWNFGDLGTSLLEDPAHAYDGSGTFHIILTATDDRLCVDTASYPVFVVSEPVVDFTLPATTICEGEAVMLNGILSPGYQYAQWDFGDGIFSNTDEKPQHAYDNDGIYTISLTAKYPACPEKQAAQTVTVRNFPVVQLGKDTSICPGSAPYVISNYLYTPGNRYLWNTGDTTAQIAILEPGTYWVEGRDGTCRAADTIEVVKSCYVEIPNVFTPDGDGVNDYFFPRQLLSKGLTNFHMQIYSRWGQLIFETKANDGRGWDGMMNDVPQSSGVYIYVMEASFANGTAERHQGNVTLLR